MNLGEPRADLFVRPIPKFSKLVAQIHTQIARLGVLGFRDYPPPEMPTLTLNFLGLSLFFLHVGNGKMQVGIVT